MCSILGASFAPGSTIDRQALTHALLEEGQVRGSHASGWAFVRGDEDGMFKAAIPGSKLSVEDIPQDSDAIIAHTRWATTGEPSDNRNNHPVLSPSGNIRLVHNGVIHNHRELREVLDTGPLLPDVDTSVIPAVLEELGIGNTDLIAGDAATAWFDRATGSTLHLERFSHSPVNVAFLEDGSFVFASTDSILGRALNTLKLNWWGSYPGPFDTMINGAYIQVKDGQVVESGEVDWNDDYRYSYQSHAFRTSLGGGGTQTSMGFGNVQGTEDTPAVLTDPDWPDLSDSDEDDDTGLPPIVEYPSTATISTFYGKSHSGDYVEYPNMTTLMAALRWYSNREDGAVDIVDADSEFLRWVNHFEDLGELVDNPEGDVEYLSWINEPSSMEDWGSAIPIWVKDGVDTLRKLLVG